jgi:hypothetical protein
MSVCLSIWNNPVPTGWIFMKYDIGVLFQNLSVKFNFHQNLTRLTGNLHGDVYLVHTNTTGSITNFLNTWKFLGKTSLCITSGACSGAVGVTARGSAARRRAKWEAN